MNFSDNTISDFEDHTKHYSSNVEMITIQYFVPHFFLELLHISNKTNEARRNLFLIMHKAIGGTPFHIN